VDAQARLAYDVSPRHQVAFTTLLGRAAFVEGEEELGVNDRAEATSHAWLAAMSWRYLPGSRFAVTNRVYSTGVDYDQVNPGGVTLDAARAHDVGWRADASYAPAAGWLVTFGGDAQQLHGRSVRERAFADGPRTLNSYRESAAAGSAYAQVRIELPSRLSVTPGARVDYWGLTGDRTASPWLSAEWRVRERTRLRGGTGFYRQFADVDQLFGFQGGGAELRPERAVHADGGIEHDLSANTRVTVTAYQRLEQDVLWTPLAEPQRRVDGTIRPGAANAPWTNGLEGRARGVELVLRRDAPDGLSGWAGYAYSRARYTDVTGRQTFWGDVDQRHTLSLYGNYRLSSRSTVSAKLRYGSNYPLRGYVGGATPAAPLVDGQPAYYALAGTRNTMRLPAYTRLDVRADRAFHWRPGRLVLFVEVANALNRTNLRNTPFGVDRNGRIFGATEPLMPIVPSAGFVFEF
jgi:hypothetical protein